MKTKTQSWTAEFTMPDDPDTVYTMTREVIGKEFLERELIKEGVEVISIKRTW